MKIGPIQINLARPTPPNTTGAEIGTSANGMLPSIFDGDFIDLSKIKVADFKKMLDNDGTVQALYNTIVMPILGSNWTIEPEDDSPEAVKQSEWVEESIKTPPHKGGMSTPFDLVIAQTLRGVIEGFSGFEKVLTLKDGKVVFRKVAWRDPTTITLRGDDRGGFNGFRQRAFIGDSYVDVTIPIERSFLYTYGKEFHNLKGRSAFTSAYSSYDKKRRLYYLAEQQAQSDALKIKVVKGAPKASQGTLDATVEAVDELGFKATVGIPDGYTVEALNQAGGLNLLPLIEHHNAEMARSVLAMFILLGTGSKTGSYSLSQDQSDFFIQALMSIRKGLENHFTSYLISDLYAYNFEKPLYGTFKFEDITDSTIELLKQVFIKLTEKDRLPQDVVDGVVQKVADKLDIDRSTLDKAVKGEQDPNTPSTSENSKKKNSFSTDGWRRDLTPAEKRVNFTGIEKKLNSLEAEFERTARPIYDDIIKGATAKINDYLESGKYESITAKNVFDENLTNQYTRILKESGLEAYVYGKNGASDELDVKAPATPKESKNFFRDNAVSVTDKQFGDLIFKVNAKVAEGRRKDLLSKGASLSVGEILAGITALFGDYYSSVIGLTASALVSMGVNKGRKDVFTEYKSDIQSYQYSAILDSVTCPICEDLDGKVVDEKEYKNTSFDPPIHHHCRCIWVAILIDELDPPAITGLPVAPGGVTEPSLSSNYETESDKLSLSKRVDFLEDALATNIANEGFSDEE